MKKITLSLVVFALFAGVFGAYNTASATVSLQDEGCTLGYTYNPYTGARCSNSVLPEGCQPGYLFSPITGARCTSLPAPTPVPAYPVGQIIVEGVSGPQKLEVNQKGTWKVSAYDRNGRDLSYSVKWGDENIVYASGAMVPVASPVIQQSATFTHTYTNAGTYYPTFTVSNDYGSESTSLSVVVGNTITTKGTLYIEPASISLKINENTEIAAYYQAPMPTCSRYVACAQVMPSRIKVDPDWGVKWANDGTIIADFENINGEWTLKGVSSGITELTARYTPARGTDLTATAKVTVGSSRSSVTVLSPNGGEVWQRGTNKSIDWKNATSASKRYDISLSSDIPSSAVPYTIARNVAGTFYHDALTFWWPVGKIIDGNYTPPDGRYKVRVCQTDTEICDLSDSYFKLTSGATQPFIALTGSYNENIYEKSISVKVGDIFTISAEPQGLELGEMSYWYGNGKPPAGYYNRAWFFDQNFINSNSCTQEIWSMKCTVKTAGTSHLYVTVYVNGTSYTSNKIAVEAVSSSATSIKVISPNGGETYALGDNLKYNVKYSSKTVGDVYHYLTSRKDLDADRHMMSGAQGYQPWSTDASGTVILDDNNITPGSYYWLSTWQNTDGTGWTYDFSDSSFKIVSGTTGTNHAPEIIYSSHRTYDNTVALSELETFSWKAQDENKDTLSWWTDWGDGVASGGGCEAVPVASGDYSKSWEYSASHEWKQPGTYKVQTTAMDCRGGTDISYVYITIAGNDDGSIYGAESFTFTQKLELGMEGNEVKELQKYLAKNGYYNGDIDGKFGLKTQRALVSFQHTNGLKADGIVGTAVRNILNK